MDNEFILEILRMHVLTKDWWLCHKSDYIFDPEWFEAFRHIDPRLTIPTPKPDGTPDLGKMGVVFWHKEDGKTVIPVGITYREGSEFIFCYHPNYANDPDTRPIAVSLPKQPFLHHVSDPNALLPYFDNLVSEGWLGLAQRNACHQIEQKEDLVHDMREFRKRDDGAERYKRLLLFSRGVHGAIAIVDAVAPDSLLDEERTLALRSQATVVGAQPKWLAVQVKDGFRYAEREDFSTHIAKLPVEGNPHILEDEFLNTLATRVLIPEDKVVEATLGMEREHGKRHVLLIKRFDRTPDGGRIHFEEALQIRNEPERKKLGLPYRELAGVARKLTGEKGVRQLFKRVIAQFLLGNTDGHFKNFAFWQQNGAWEMTPNYDLGSTVKYNDSRLPLLIDPHSDRMYLKHLDGKKIALLGKEFGLDIEAVKGCVDELRSHIEAAKDAIMAAQCSAISQEMTAEFCKKLDGRVERQFGTFDRYYAYQKSRHSHRSP